MLTREKLVAELTKSKERGKREGSTGGDNASYAFWNIPDNQQALVRFLPDGDPDNSYFWVRKETITLDFEGVVGGENPHHQARQR